MFRNFLKWLGVVESGLSVAETIARAVSFLLIGGGGIVSGFLAHQAPALAEFGQVAWVLIGIVAALLIALTLFLFQLANQSAKKAEYVSAMAQRGGTINPLADHFQDQIIYIEDLRLPGMMLHKNKLFKRCKFVGPGALFLAGGGTVRDNGFHECGSVIPCPDDALVAGLIVLENCTILDCEFFRITLVASQATAKALANAGFRVAGYHEGKQVPALGNLTEPANVDGQIPKS